MKSYSCCNKMRNITLCYPMCVFPISLIAVVVHNSHNLLIQIEPTSKMHSPVPPLDNSTQAQSLPASQPANSSYGSFLHDILFVCCGTSKCGHLISFPHSINNLPSTFSWCRLLDLPHSGCSHCNDLHWIYHDK